MRLSPPADLWKDRKKMQYLLGVMVLRGTRSPHCEIRSGTGAENGVVLSSVSLLPENWFETEASGLLRSSVLEESVLGEPLLTCGEADSWDV